MAYLVYRPTQTLFQYTSIDGFRGIVNSKRLRLSDLRAANDPREIKLGADQILEALKAQAPSQALSRVTTNLERQLQVQQAFCACFSLDGDLLPMWAMYGENFGGVSIGFRPTAIINMPGRIQRVTYLDPSNEAEEINRIVSRVIAGVGTIKYPQEILQWVNIGVEALAAAIAMKHRQWTHEKEVRIVFAQRKERLAGELANAPVSLTPMGKPVAWREPMERNVGTRSVRFVEFPFGKAIGDDFDPSGAIETVILGPNCILSLSDVEAELKAQGFRDFTVKKSECQIRT